MAYYAALVPLVQLLREIIQPDHQYPNPNSNLDKQRIDHVSLYEKFNLVQELLADYLPKDHTGESSHDDLERRIRDAAHRAQDIIESQMSNLIPRRLEDLEKVREEVDSIVEELVRIRESQTGCGDSLRSSYFTAGGVGGALRGLASSGRNSMVGFEEYLIRIKDQLCGQSSRRKVISIVGMGGLGKTTLARSIFDDKLIDYHFDCRAWVTVSQDYLLRNILVALVASLNIETELHGVEEGVLEEQIYKYLKGRRYMIIIDDMWETRVWDDVKRMLPDDSNGSRVVITTRVSNVAVYAGNSSLIHHLPFLNEDQSWSLFCQKVFCPPELADIGRLISRNCRGLPLAIVVVAGLLSKVSKTQHDWEEIARNVSLVAIDQNDKHFENILSLSYNHLPHHLKPCFLYLGGFPEDYEISVSKLIKLWVAEGFLKPIESKTAEEVGEECLEDLINRNLVMITKWRFSRKFKRCSIHDLLRDLCLQRAHDEHFLHCVHKNNELQLEPLRSLHRLYIHTWNDSLLCKYKNEHFSRVRTILFFPEIQGQRHFLSTAPSFKLLRVLGTASLLTSPFPNAFVELLHLRYLALWGPTICIPPSIFKLQNLQTLIVDGEASLTSEIWKMPQLRHVISNLEVTLPPIPYDEIAIVDGVPLLGKLQTLRRVKDLRFTIDTIEMIPSLKKLKVCCTYEPHRNWQKLRLNNLVRLRQLETLEIYFYKWRAVIAPLPKNFAFPGTLMKLTLDGCQLPWKDITVVGSLPNLRVLKLRDDAFVGEEWQPVDGEFATLKSLLMENLHDLRYWRAENIHFPCLEQLHVRFCWDLQEIPPGIGDISTLEVIEVHQCNSGVESSALKIQEEQRDQGNDDLQVRVVPRV